MYWHLPSTIHYSLAVHGNSTSWNSGDVSRYPSMNFLWFGFIKWFRVAQREIFCFWVTALPPGVNQEWLFHFHPATYHLAACLSKSHWLAQSLKSYITSLPEQGQRPRAGEESCETAWPWGSRKWLPHYSRLLVRAQFSSPSNSSLIYILPAVLCQEPHVSPSVMLSQSQQHSVTSSWVQPDDIPSMAECSQ